MSARFCSSDKSSILQQVLLRRQALASSLGVVTDTMVVDELSINLYSLRTTTTSYMPLIENTFLGASSRSYWTVVPPMSIYMKSEVDLMA